MRTTVLAAQLATLQLICPTHSTPVPPPEPGLETTFAVAQHSSSGSSARGWGGHLDGDMEEPLQLSSSMRVSMWPWPGIPETQRPFYEVRLGVSIDKVTDSTESCETVVAVLPRPFC